MKIELVQEPTYSLKVGDKTLGIFTQTSTWEGLSKLTAPNGDYIIVKRDEKLFRGFLPDNDTANVLCGTNRIIGVLMQAHENSNRQAVADLIAALEAAESVMRKIGREDTKDGAAEAISLVRGQIDRLKVVEKNKS